MQRGHSQRLAALDSGRSWTAPRLRGRGASCEMAMAPHMQVVDEKGVRPSLHVSMFPAQRRPDKGQQEGQLLRAGAAWPPTAGCVPGLGSSTHIKKTARTGTRREHRRSGLRNAALGRRRAGRCLEGLERPPPRSPPGPHTCFFWVPVLGLDLCSFSCSSLSIALSRWSRFIKEKALKSH